MQFSIHTHGIDLTETIKRQAHEKLELALDRLEDDVVSISVFLIDTNGPFLGGVDKACRIVVQIRKQDALVVEDIDERVEVVIERITDRLGVVACKRADSLYKKTSALRRWLDSDDSTLWKN
jgi:ribosome-associated translation inhibitor RaiA